MIMQQWDSVTGDCLAEERRQNEAPQVAPILLGRASFYANSDVFFVEPLCQFLHRDRLATRVAFSRGILAIAGGGDDGDGPDTRLLAGQHRIWPKADPPRPTSCPVLYDIALAPAGQYSQAEAWNIAVPDKVFGGLGLCGVDEALREFWHGKSAFKLSGFHSAHCERLVNEHIEIA